VRRSAPIGWPLVASTLGSRTSPSRTFSAGLQLATACLVVLLVAPAVAQAKPRITKGPEAVTPGEKVRFAGKRFPSEKNVQATVQPEECAPLTCTNAILGKGVSSRDWAVDDRGRTGVRFRWPHGYLVHDADFGFTDRYPWLVGEPASVRICSAPARPRCATAFVRTEQPPVEPPLENTFVALAITEDGRPRPIVPGTRMFVTISENVNGQPFVGVDAGCGKGGDLEVAPDRLIVGDLAGPSVPCRDDDALEQQQQLERFILSDPRWRLVNGRDLILSSGVTVIELAAGPFEE
jgi:hypothetical protein